MRNLMYHSLVYLLVTFGICLRLMIVLQHSNSPWLGTGQLQVYSLKAVTILPHLPLLLDLGAGLLLFRIVCYLLENRLCSLCAVGVYMSYPLFRPYLSWSLQESLYLFLNLLVLFAFILYFKSVERDRLIGLFCGLSLGISILLRPELFPFLLLFAGIAGLQCFYTRKRVRPYLICLVCCLLLLFPWFIHGQLLQPPSIHTQTTIEKAGP